MDDSSDEKLGSEPTLPAISVSTNVLNKLPKGQQSKAERVLQEIWMAETKKDVLVVFDAFVENRGVKYDKAVECLIKDRHRFVRFTRAREAEPSAARRIRAVRWNGPLPISFWGILFDLIVGPMKLV